jgi:tripartite tricarboxylate transporter family receptor
MTPAIAPLHHVARRQRLRRLGQPFIVENRPGASSNIATEAVVRAPADGYMLLATDAAASIRADRLCKSQSGQARNGKRASRRLFPGSLFDGAMGPLTALSQRFRNYQFAGVG